MTTATAQPHALTHLLAGYIAGDVSHDAMERFDDLCETASSQERLAFARFYLDAIASDDVAALPTADEAAGILAAVRA